jgi:hypothetical protein
VVRLPPGSQCAEADNDVQKLAVCMEAIEKTQTRDRQSVRDRTTEQFNSHRVMYLISMALHLARRGDEIETQLRVQSRGAVSSGLRRLAQLFAMSLE